MNTYSKTMTLRSLLEEYTWNRSLREHLILGLWAEVRRNEGLPENTLYTGSVLLSDTHVTINIHLV
jgi:hypothetical protein